MTSPAVEFPRTRRALRWILGLSLGLSAGLLVLAAILGSFGDTRLPIIFSLLGFAVGAFLALVDLNAFRRLPTAVITALAALICSQVCYHILVWTPGRTEPLVWRLGGCRWSPR